MTDQPDYSSTLTRFSLGRKITVLVSFLSIIVVGVIATLGIPLELLPRGFTGQSLQVVVPWTDAPAREVLDKITLPMEEELSTVKGLDSMNSYSRIGQAWVHLRFKQGTDMAVAYRETRDRVERAKRLFPRGADRVYIRKQDSSGIPVVFLGMTVDSGLVDYYDLIQDEVIKPISRIDGVANVQPDGLEEKEIIIEVDRDLAEGAGLNIYDLSQQLGDDNFTLASGNVRDGGRKFLLRSVATYPNLQALENRLVSPTLRLKDIAKIRYEEAEKNYSVRVDGEQAIALAILKEGEANTVQVSKAIDEVVLAMQDNPKLAGVRVETLFNQGDMIEESLDNLIGSGKIGGFFAAIVLFFFLRRFRLTAIITLSIPISLLMALSAMFFMGQTLNILSILGLVICVGLLVDNSVVVAENIHRLHRNGMARREACIKGAGEIALAIVMATLTTIIVFLPVSLVDGQAQFFLLRLSLPISVSLAASLLLALIFIPLSVYLTLPVTRKKKDTLFNRLHQKMNDILRRAYELTFERINRFYTKCLGLALKYRIELVFLIFGIFALTQFVAFKGIEFVENQEEDRTNFSISVMMSREHGFEDTKEYFLEAEKVLAAKKEEYGFMGYLAVHHTRGGRLEGWLDDKSPVNLTAKQIVEKLAEDLPKWAGVKLRFGREDAQRERDKGKDLYSVMLSCEDVEKLEVVADSLEPILLKVEGVIGIKKGSDPPPSELALVIDRDRANAGDVNPEFIAGVVSYALRGSPLPRYNDGGREIPVRVRFREEDRASLAELSSFAVPTNQGGILPVSALTNPVMLKARRGIFRRDKKIYRIINLELSEENTKQIRDRLTAVLAQIEFPEGVSLGGAPSRSGPNEDLANMAFAGVVSILFIYLLMGFLFESFILPLSIIFTIPLAGIGVGWVHFIAGKDIDFLGVVGCILLIGVVVNNGIVLIDYVNRLRGEGYDRTKALLIGAERRFRPIVMTALTTVIGMIPLTLSKPNSMGLSYTSFGLTLIGGMTTATLLTLLVVPVFYTLFDDARQNFASSLKLFLGGKSRHVSGPAPQKAA